MLIPKGAIARAAGPELGGPQPPVRTDDLGSAVLIVGAISVFVTTIALALRLWARAQSNKWSFWWDDWVLIVTTLFSHGFLALNMAWTRLGLGKHVENIDMSSLLPTIYMSKASILMYAICIYLIKVSALLLYARVFNRSKRFRLVLRWLGGAVTAWFLCTALVPWFNCNPIRKTIDPFVPGVCFDRMDWFLASAFINAAIDLTILIMPLQQVWKLQMTTRRKIQVTLVFILGYCSAFLSFSRFIIIIRDPTVMSVEPVADPYYHTVPILLISMLEAPFAIVALCAPTIGQFGASAFEGGKFASRLSSIFRSKQSGGNSRDTQKTYESKESGPQSHFGSVSDATPRRYVPLESKQPFKTTSITQQVSPNPNSSDIAGYGRNSIHIGRTDRSSEEDTVPMTSMHRYGWDK